MKFKYTALNQQNKETTGVLEAPDVEYAKQQLHQMSLSILVINKISDEEYQKWSGKEQKEKIESGIVTYIFQAKDPYQKTIEGTIDAKDIYLAFKRLITNYHFQVLALHPKEQDDLADGILETNFKADLEQWKTRLKEEGIDIEAQIRPEPVDKDLEGEAQILNRKMVEEIDQFIIQVKGILKLHSEHFSVAFLEEIHNKLSNLERIRSSNNIENITKVSNELYELLSHPDRFATTSPEKQIAYNQSLSGIKENELIQQQYETEKKVHQLSVMKGGFENVLEKLKSIKPAMPSMETTSVTDWRFLSKSFWLYLKAPRGPLKEARYEAFKNAMEKRKIKVQEEKRVRKEKWNQLWNSRFNRDYSFFFMELNSFFGWLLAFYITYFFLVLISVEKGLGLPESFVLKTLESPLIFNITLLLLWAHLILKIKLYLFHRQFLGSFLLFVFSGLIYGMVVVNF